MDCLEKNNLYNYRMGKTVSLRLALGASQHSASTLAKAEASRNPKPSGVPDSLGGRVLPPADDDRHLFAAALAAGVVERAGGRGGSGSGSGRGSAGRRGCLWRVGRDLDGQVAGAVVALDHASRRRRRRNEVTRDPLRLPGVVAVEQRESEGRQAGVGTLAAVGAVELFLEQ